MESSDVHLYRLVASSEVRDFDIELVEARRHQSGDMWDPYVESVREHVAQADRKIVFDKFHVAQHLGKAVDEVRRKENKDLRAGGDVRLDRYPATTLPQVIL